MITITKFQIYVYKLHSLKSSGISKAEATICNKPSLKLKM